MAVCKKSRNEAKEEVEIEKKNEREKRKETVKRNKIAEEKTEDIEGMETK